MANRICKIISASVGEDESRDGDGQYDLHDLDGSPKEIGVAIAEALANTSMLRCKSATWLPDAGKPLYLRVVVRIEAATA